jgi:flagellar biosynthesis protein FlhF
VPESEPASAEAETMRHELCAIKEMVGQVLHHQSTARRRTPDAAMPPRLLEMYNRLIEQELCADLADRLINETRDELTADELDDEQVVREAVSRKIRASIPVSEDDPPISRTPDGRPCTIALVGPTGVGKTTTVAKLAASFKIHQRRRVGLVTADTYRIAAVDQLRTYANIIGLPLKVVLTPAEMRQAVESLSHCDVILIDTAGRGQNDCDRLEELRAFVGAADPHEVHLVLSGTAGEKVLLREAEAFGRVGADKVVLTKLDEAVSFGMLVDVVRQVGKELSYVTTGQEVPDHIERARADRLAELVVGGALERPADECVRELVPA